MTALAILAMLAAAYWLLKARPFKTCPRCKGYGSKTSILTGPTPCRACHGTGLRSRTQRRKMRRLPGGQSSGRSHR